MPFTTSIPSPHLAALRLSATAPGATLKENDPNSDQARILRELVAAGLVERGSRNGIATMTITTAGTAELARLDALA